MKGLQFEADANFCFVKYCTLAPGHAGPHLLAQDVVARHDAKVIDAKGKVADLLMSGGDRAVQIYQHIGGTNAPPIEGGRFVIDDILFIVKPFNPKNSLPHRLFVECTNCKRQVTMGKFLQHFKSTRCLKASAKV